MDADNHNASIAIELRHTDPVLRENYFNKFLALKPMITEILGEHWEWQPAVKDEDEKLISRIGIVIKGVNVFDAGDWPTIISFLKPRMLALDQAWSLVKDNFI